MTSPAAPALTVPPPTRSSARARAAAFGALILGGALAIVSAAQPWWRAVGQDVSVRFSGTEVTGGLSQALAVVALAGTLLILVLQPRGRRVAGVLLVMVGVALAVVGALRQRPSDEAVRTQVREVTLLDQFALSGTAWPWVYASAGGVVVLGAVLVVTTVHRWPRRADRFARTEGMARPVTVDDDAMEVWKAMDAGLDPTVNDDQAAGTPADPDVHRGRARDRIDRELTDQDRAEPEQSSRLAE